MSRKSSHHDSTPVYCIQSFESKRTSPDFYIRNFKEHLREHEFVSRPHKHDFYLILYVTVGGGEHIIDFNSYNVSPNSIFLMTPGQVHSWRLDKNTDGYIIFFTRNFYQMNLSKNNLLEFPFYDSLNASPHLELPNDAAINFSFSELEAEYKNVTAPDLRLLRAYLDLLLLKFARYFSGGDVIEVTTATQRLRKLEQLIERNFVKHKQASDYADLMHLSTAHLNTLCKENLQKTLSQLIHERVILEAKRLLAFTDLNINEIAYSLGFSDTSYFTRFFKKNNGNTPDDFRASVKSTI